MKDVFDKLSKFDGGKVLDAATGRGEFIQQIIQNFRRFDQIIGIDFNEKAVKHAQHLYPDNNIEIYKMNLESMAFTDGYFDTVCISNSLHHLEHPERVLNEMVRVLKPGGLFVLVEMYQDGKQSQAQNTHIMMHHWIASIDRMLGNFHRQTFLRDEIMGFINSLPFQKTEVEDYYVPLDNPKDPKDIEPLIRNIEEWIQKCRSLNEEDSICNEGFQIIDRIKNIGCVSASKLFVTARKK